MYANNVQCTTYLCSVRSRNIIAIEFHTRSEKELKQGVFVVVVVGGGVLKFRETMKTRILRGGEVVLYTYVQSSCCKDITRSARYVFPYQLEALKFQSNVVLRGKQSEKEA